MPLAKINGISPGNTQGMKVTVESARTKKKNGSVDSFIHADVPVPTRLQVLSDDHFNTDPDDLHWGHVGNLGHIETQLQQIVDFVFQEGEHAN
ncbi:MAG: hypothetical protein HQM04_19260 [Magnetococcales bacterium]|nr:hypothetical protein [Magnetococcales bacterium]